MVGDRDDANVAGKYLVDQRIRKLQSECGHVVLVCNAQFRGCPEQYQRVFELVEEIIRSGKRQFFEIPVDSRFEICQYLGGKANSYELLWLRQCGRGFWTWPLLPASTLRAFCFHVRNAPGDFLAPGLGDDFGRIFGPTLQAYDQAVDEFAALLR